MPDESRLGETFKSYCSSCKGQRNCEVLGHHLQSGEDGDGYYQWNTNWYLLICRGCDFVFAQSVSTNSDDYTDYFDELGNAAVVYHETVKTMPARAKRDRPEWFSHDIVESEINDTYELDASLKELYGALDHDVLVLASIGLRTSFDIAAELLGVDPNKTFAQKVTDLVERNLIKESEKDHIDILVEAGSASAHRGWKPNLSDLDALMDTLEEFIYNSMVLPARRKAAAERIAMLKTKVPPRPPPKRKTAAAEPSPTQADYRDDDI
jgi:hypothetical protein